jgi:co-chaperonin GroES (HSP10)
MTINTSGINPVEYNVLVKPAEVEKTTKGGLLLPETKVEKDEYGRTEGTLVAVSARAFMFDGPVLPDDPKVGDTVVFSRYQATEMTGVDGAKYWMMKDRSIAGVVQK